MSEFYGETIDEEKLRQFNEKVDSICSIGEEVLDKENLINLLKHKKEI